MANDQLPEEIIPEAEVESFVNPDSAPVATETAGFEQSKTGTDSFTPTETFTWRYSLWDLVDEFFWAIIFLLVWLQLVNWIPQNGQWATPSHILSFLFGIGILYFTFFIFTPLRIFHRGKKDANEPNVNSFFYDFISFLIFLSAILILLSRLVTGLFVVVEKDSAKTNEPAAAVAEVEESEASIEVPELKSEKTDSEAEKMAEPIVAEKAPKAEEAPGGRSASGGRNSEGGRSASGEKCFGLCFDFHDGRKTRGSRENWFRQGKEIYFGRLLSRSACLHFRPFHFPLYWRITD